MKIPFHKPILPADLDSIYPDSVKAGWLTTGPQVASFEAKLGNYLQVENVVAVNSCTAALHLALAAKGFESGDKFIVPTYTFVASVEVGEYLSMEPVLVDSKPDGFNLDLNQVEDILKKDGSIKAIIPVHFAGELIDRSQLNYLSEKYDVFILEDAAHALESIALSDSLNNNNSAVAFSFYANKNITTGGEGGALATDDRDLAEQVRKLSLHGLSKDGWKRFGSGGKWRYDVSALGYKYNMTDLSASFGLWQIERVASWQIRRKEIVQKYQDGFQEVDGMTCPTMRDDAQHSCHLYVVKLKPEKWQISRDKLIEMINKKGIGTSVHYSPIHMHSYYQNKYGYQPDDFPLAKRLSENVITLPLFPALTDMEVNYIIETITDLWHTYQN
jgi:dTDP-4-amino-4,6-dideoxygalactose transaminase